MSPPRILWYFADPMCSWCWGFAPVVEVIREAYAEQLQLALVMGGLRAGLTTPITPALREEVLHHWHEVQERTGQPFRFDNALPEGFVYDTEPPCRAVVVVEELKPEVKFPYFKSVQAAFYAEQRDVTQAVTLADLAERQGMDRERFLESFETPEIKQRTWVHFDRAHSAGILGFPTLVLQRGGSFKLVTYGYATFEKLRPVIDDWLVEQEQG